MQVLAIADDMTGALEVGAQFAAAGVRSLVTTANTLMGETCALVVDLETRPLKPARAGRRVARLVAAAREKGIRYLYKKTDSTLRGNIASEFQALLDAFPEHLLVYVPAYPKMGRVVKGGELYVDGVPLAGTTFAADPTQPSRDGSIPSLIEAGCKAPVLLAATAARLEVLLLVAQPGSIIVCDGAVESDLEGIALAISRSDRACLAAGTGGFSGYWVKSVPIERGIARNRPSVRRCLVVSGSQHPVSREQFQRAVDAGIPGILLGGKAAADARTVSDVSAALAARGRAVLQSPGTCRPGVAERLGAITGRVLGSQPVDGLIVFGGSTLYAILRALGVKVIEPVGEVTPGVAVSEIRHRNRNIALITKAGGFGDSGSLVSILRHLEDRR